MQQTWVQANTVTWKYLEHGLHAAYVICLSHKKMHAPDPKIDPKMSAWNCCIIDYQ
jgi:hypothetical protein